MNASILVVDGAPEIRTGSGDQQPALLAVDAERIEKEIQEPEIEVVVKKKPARRIAGSKKAATPRPKKQVKSAAKPCTSGPAIPTLLSSPLGKRYVYRNR